MFYRAPFHTHQVLTLCNRTIVLELVQIHLLSTTMSPTTLLLWNASHHATQHNTYLYLPDVFICHLLYLMSLMNSYWYSQGISGVALVAWNRHNCTSSRAAANGSRAAAHDFDIVILLIGCSLAALLPWMLAMYCTRSCCAASAIYACFRYNATPLFSPEYLSIIQRQSRWRGSLEEFFHRFKLLTLLQIIGIK